MNGSQLRRALRDGQRVYGTCIISPSPSWPGAVAATGVDFVFIDTEHIAQDRVSLSWMCRAYSAMGLAPVVRIPSPDPYEACKVFDGGAAGVIAPYVETAEQVRHLVGAAKLRPLKGARLARGLEDPATLEPELRQYLEQRSASSVLIVNIESVPAMENLDGILSVDGLDAVLIGPHDLSCSLGIPEQYRDPRFDRAVREIIGKARARGIGAGIHYSSGVDQEIEWARDGSNLIIHSSDLALFTETVRRDITAMKKALGDGAGEGRGQGVIV